MKARKIAEAVLALAILVGLAIGLAFATGLILGVFVEGFRAVTG